MRESIYSISLYILFNMGIYKNIHIYTRLYNRMLEAMTSKLSMARLLVVIPDELEKRLRDYIEVKYKGKKQGFISYTVTEAIERYLQEEETKK